jgi:hypothetical protein
MYGLMLLPPGLVATGLLIREIAIYRGLQPHGYAPSPLVWGLFWLIEVAIPHLLIMRQALLQQTARTGKAGTRAKALASEGGVPRDEKGHLEAKQKEAEQDLAAIRGPQQQSQKSNGQADSPGLGAASATMQSHSQSPSNASTLSLGCQPPQPAQPRDPAHQARPTLPRQETLRSLINARKMVRHAAASRTYTSRLPCSQVGVVMSLPAFDSTQARWCVSVSLASCHTCLLAC